MVRGFLAHMARPSSVGRQASGVSAVSGTCCSVPPVGPAKNVGVRSTRPFVACCADALSAASTSADGRSAIIFCVSKPGIDSPILRRRSSVIQPEFSAPWLLKSRCEKFQSLFWSPAA